jgi:enoyl-CoA hydratase/carnithine racemase
MTMSGFETLLYEKSPQKVGTITLNRPDAMNTFNGTMCAEFSALWRTIAEDEEVNAVVLRASPGRAFSAGMDVWNPGNYLGSEQLWNKRDPGERLGPKSNLCWKPVITAVHGICAGGAFYWLNESDITVCSEDAQFFDPHVTYGMTSALEPIGLRWRVALPEVLRMALMGNDERIGAQTALRISLVTEVVSAEQLWNRAHEIAVTIAQKPSVATQGTVRAIWESLDSTRTASLNTALKYCLLGNETGRKQVSRNDLMDARKSFRVR